MAKSGANRPTKAVAVKHQERRGAICSGTFLNDLYLFWFGTFFQRWGVSTTTVDFFRVSTARRELEAWCFTLLGVLCFSFTFPMTRLALASFDPVMIALARGAGAGSAALIYLALSRSRVPSKAQLLRIAGASAGMVILFPLLMSSALRFVPATHASVMAAILPLLTAFFGVIRGRESGTFGFWVSAVAGSVLLVLFCGYRSGFHGIDRADLLLLAGFGACAYGYAEGGLLARELGGWQVICWILVSVLPLELTGLFGFAALNGIWLRPPSASAWVALAYLTLISQFIGFYFYYNGLGLGGVARMSQAQLLMPLLAIFASGLLLGEEIDGVVAAGAVVISGIVLVGRWSLWQKTARSPSVREMYRSGGGRGSRRFRRRVESEPEETVPSEIPLYQGDVISLIGPRAELLKPDKDWASLLAWTMLLVASLATLLLAAAGFFSWWP